jgi:hypothetical protein
MRTGWQWTGTAVVAVGLALGISGCASMTYSTESLLTQAGFRKIPADTPQKVEHLKTLPEHRVVGRTHNGKKYYVFADLADCRCLYVGSPQAYQSYQSLAKAQQVEQMEGVEEARQWEIENSGLQ